MGNYVSQQKLLFNVAYVAGTADCRLWYESSQYLF
jgi:hypothetical protein